jgi:hypothetical protein
MSPDNRHLILPELAPGHSVSIHINYPHRPRLRTFENRNTELPPHLGPVALSNYARNPIEAIVIMIRIAMTVPCCAQDLALTVVLLP